MAIIEKWGAEALPWAFTASGLVLGAGAIALERPLAGLCGAIAGVTAGLIEHQRANAAERTVSSLRARLRDQREKSEENAAGLRRQVRELQAELWQRDLDRVSADALAALAAEAAAEAQAVQPVQAEPVVTGPPSGPIARVIDLRGTPAEKVAAVPDPETGEIPAAAAG